MAHLGSLGKRSVSEGIAGSTYELFRCHVVFRFRLSRCDQRVSKRICPLPEHNCASGSGFTYFQETPFLGNWQAIDYEGVVVQLVTFARLPTH